MAGDRKSGKHRPFTRVQRLTVDLWPDAGYALGLGRNSTFKAARTGEIPTIRIGKRLLVSKVKLAGLLEL